MLSLNSVSAWIEVDGKELEQYGIEEDPENNEVTCWIATQVDKKFSVLFRDDMEHRTHSLASCIRLDGSSIAGKVLPPPTSTPNLILQSSRKVAQDNQVISATSRRSFLFSKLELTDEDEYLNESPAKLGEMQILIYRVEVMHESIFQPLTSLVSGHSKVHERSKKAVSHSVSYGQEEKTRTVYSCQVRSLDGNIPFATFTFKYRDLGLLQANGIAPKPPPVEKKEVVSGEVLDLTIRNNVKSERVDEEIEIVDNNRATVRKKRSKTYDGDKKPLKKIKRETKFVPTGEIIDLT